MAELLGIEKLNSVLNKFLEPFESYAKIGTEFYCFTGINEIVYSLVVSQKQSKTFMDRVRRLYPQITASEFLWGFLHELGHIETVDLLDYEDWEYSHNLKIQKGTDMSDEEYYELPDEFAATDWAANYMLENESHVREFWAEVTNAIFEIYRLNKIEVGGINIMTQIQKLALAEDRLKKLKASVKNVKCPGAARALEREIRNMRASLAA